MTQDRQTCDTYRDGPDKRDAPKVARGHVLDGAADGVGVDEIDMAVGVDLFDDVEGFEVLGGFDFGFLDGGGHGYGGFFVGHVSPSIRWNGMEKEWCIELTSVCSGEISMR